MLTRVKNTNGYSSLLNQILNDDFLYSNFSSFKPEFTPTQHINEEENHFSIELALPGLVKEDLKIELDNNNLKVEYKVEEGKEVHFVKSFTKSYILPKNANKDDISAEFTNGILHLTIPKKEEVKISKEISIQ